MTVHTIYLALFWAITAATLAVGFLAARESYREGRRRT